MCLRKLYPKVVVSGLVLYLEAENAHRCGLLPAGGIAVVAERAEEDGIPERPEGVRQIAGREGRGDGYAVGARQGAGTELEGGACL